MLLRANYEFLFVGRDENSFLENYVYDLHQDHGLKSGQIFVNLEILNNPLYAEEMGAMLFDTLQTVFFENLEEEPYARFEAALRAANEGLKEFKESKGTDHTGEINMIVAAVCGNQLFLSQAGDSEAYLVRKRYVSVVSEGLSEDRAEGSLFSAIASGQIEERDFVIFSTTRLMRYIGKTDLAQAIRPTSAAETLDVVRDIIATEILGRIGLIGMSFELDKEIKREGDEVEQREERKIDKEIRREGEKRGSREVKKVLAAMSGIGGKMSGIGAVVRDRFSSGDASKNRVLIILVGLIVVLVIGIFLASGHKAKQDEIERLDDVLSSVQDRIAEAQTKAAFDKDVARDLLDQAYLDAKSVLDSGIYREKATLLLVDIENTLDTLDNVERIAEPELVVDLAEKDAAINALGFATVAEKVFVYGADSLYEILVNEVQDAVELEKGDVVVSASGFEERRSTVFLTRAGKMLEARDGTVSLMDTDDGDFRKGTAIADYSNRVYMLDGDEGQVYKYTYKGTMERFGVAEEYIVDKTDVKGAVDIAIDGTVYVLMANGEILKFYAGEKVDFFINKAPAAKIGNPSRIYTNEKLSDVFVLDGVGRRVFVYGKETSTGDLVYKAQYLFDGVSELRDLYVDSATNTLYVMSGGKVFRKQITN